MCLAAWLLSNTPDIFEQNTTSDTSVHNITTTTKKNNTYKYKNIKIYKYVNIETGTDAKLYKYQLCQLKKSTAFLINTTKSTNMNKRPLNFNPLPLPSIPTAVWWPSLGINKGGLLVMVAFLRDRVKYLRLLGRECVAIPQRIERNICGNCHRKI